MSGYTKLSHSIIASTVWRAPDTIRIVWITMLAMKDQDGIVEASVPGLADLARVSIEACREALSYLASPDPDSRNKTDEGRRIREVDGGWLVVNSEVYRNRDNWEEKREKARKRKELQRSRQRSRSVTHGHALSRDVSKVTTSKQIRSDQSRSDQDLHQAESVDLAIPEIENTRALEPRARAPENVSSHSKSTNLINGADQRRHGSHAWCSMVAGREGLCVPVGLHRDFMGKGAKSDAEMRAWYRSVVESMNGIAVGEDLFEFWKNKFAEWVGIATTRPAVQSKASDKASRTMAAAERVIAKQLEYRQRKALTNGTQ